MMMRYHLFPLLFFLLLFHSTGAQEEEETPPPHVECGVYMAESTLGVANLGIYTGKPLQPGDVLPYPEIVIPLMFREWHKHGGDSLDGTLWDRYIWEGPVVHLEPMKNVLDLDSSKAGFIPGIGCTINSRLDLKNIDSTHGSVYDTAGLHRRKDVGSGAFSPYHSSQTVATAYIPAGGELFAEYGAEWIPDIPGAVVTLDENMNAADDLLEEYVKWHEQHGQDLSERLLEGLWNFTIHFPIASQVLDTLPEHTTYKTVHQAIVNNKNKDEGVVRTFLRNEGVRDLKWLEQHGRCQDHLYPDKSTLFQAGRGAFASRNLPKGSIVGYSPLIHMGNNRKLWDIQYKEPQTTTRGARKRRRQQRATKYTQQDLILNYSFGHCDSTLLLTPYGAMVNFINHSKEKANVKIQWPKHESEAHKPDWLEKDLDFLIHTIEKIGLSFEYVALRDIQQGEEVFMDYGEEWQQAWDVHVASWTPPEGASEYIHSTEWKGPLLSLAEQEETPYPPNLVTVCKESYSLDPKSETFHWTPIVRNSTHRVFCDVLDRNEESDGTHLYTVQLNYQDDNEQVVVQHVPIEGIDLMDDLLTQDWHLEGAFRHEIMIPDDMFPESWKNKVDTDAQEEGVEADDSSIGGDDDGASADEL